MKLLFPVFASIALAISQGFAHLQTGAIVTAASRVPASEIQSLPADITAASPARESSVDSIETVSDMARFTNFTQPTAYAFGNPAGCATTVSPNLTADQMLANVQASLGSTINLAELRQTYIWNGPLGTYMDVTQDTYVYEFVFNSFQPPLTYRADQVVTQFLNQGFVVWLRAYADSFRLMAVPMVTGVLNSPWADYVTTYWQSNGKPNDEFIYPVMKKLPCHWVIDAGYVSNEALQQMFKLDWHIPDYLSAGRQYLADTCHEANRIS